MDVSQQYESRRRHRRGRGLLVLVALLSVTLVVAMRMEPAMVARLIHPLRLGDVPVPGVGERDGRIRPFSLR